MRVLALGGTRLFQDATLLCKKEQQWVSYDFCDPFIVGISLENGETILRKFHVDTDQVIWSTPIRFETYRNGVLILGNGNIVAFGGFTYVRIYSFETGELLHHIRTADYKQYVLSYGDYFILILNNGLRLDRSFIQVFTNDGDLVHEFEFPLYIWVSVLFGKKWLISTMNDGLNLFDTVLCDGRFYVKKIWTAPFDNANYIHFSDQGDKIGCLWVTSLIILSAADGHMIYTISLVRMEKWMGTITALRFSDHDNYMLCIHSGESTFHRYPIGHISGVQSLFFGQQGSLGITKRLIWKF